MGLAAAYGAVASAVVVLFAPQAAGSGLAEMRCAPEWLLLPACCTNRFACRLPLHEIACKQPCASPCGMRSPGSLCAASRRAYFNGVHVSGLLSLKTFFVKMASAIFVLAAGLVAEGESPFVHVGAIVGGGFSSMGSRCAPLQRHSIFKSTHSVGMTACACLLCRAQVADARGPGPLAGQAAALGGRLVPRRGGALVHCIHMRNSA